MLRAARFICHAMGADAFEVISRRRRHDCRSADNTARSIGRDVAPLLAAALKMPLPRRYARCAAMSFAA